MELSRNKSRVVTMNILYQTNLYQKNNIEYNIEEIISENLEEDNEFIKNLVYGVIENQEQIDSLANKYLNNWKLNRLGLVDQAIIRISIYELLYTTTPNKVCIDEAIEIAKEYSDLSVAKMINGVLDKVYHNECNEK